ncbi:phosphoesterase [Candidatus Woesearchaeota archaeon]|nr:phosphoesterase [Candidatus Woesearchaeota archaeon]
MLIHPSIEAIDLALFLKKEKVLVICDLHIGYEQAMKKEGILVPRTQKQLIISRLQQILEKFRPKTIVINGDLKHEFGSINKQEWQDTIEILDLLNAKGEELLIVEGNHDPLLEPIAAKRDIKLLKEHRVGKVLIVHGDTVPNKLAPIVIIGHDHPAIVLQDGAKREKFKCYLKGTFKKSTLIVQPSFQPLVQGTNVLEDQMLSPLIASTKNFEVFIVDEETGDVLPFGKVRNFLPQ